MSRLLWSLITLTVTLLALLMAILKPGFESRSSFAQEPSGITMSLDMDALNGTGPCDPIDAAAKHQPGSDYKVAVCVDGLYYQYGSEYAYPIGFADFSVLYNDTINVAPEVVDPGDGLDGNPDANLGTTTWGSPLGSTGWECSARGDKDPATGAAHGQAFLSCAGMVGPWTLGDNESSGVLGVISFHVKGWGVDTMTISDGLLDYQDASEMGTCDPIVTFSLDCIGGSSGEPEPTPTRTPVEPTAQPTVNGVGGAVLLPPPAVTGASDGASPRSAVGIAAWVALVGGAAGMLTVGGWYAKRHRRAE